MTTARNPTRPEDATPASAPQPSLPDARDPEFAARGAPARRIVRNTRPGVDWNTCGQAAVASVLAALGAGPFAPGCGPIPDAEAIDRVREEFPPDVPFGLGTSAGRLAAALVRHGVAVEHVHSGWFGRRSGAALRRLREHLDAGWPAIVCLDLGRLDGPRWAAHWAVAVRIAPDRVWIGGHQAADELPMERFLGAWRCRHLPFRHNHCAILARRERPATGP